MTNDEHTTHGVIGTLMNGIVDYAGLFPPSQLAMEKAVTNYAKYLRGEHAAFLGRFVCPAVRLEEMSEHASVLMPGTHATSGYPEHVDVIEAWRVSCVITGDLEEQLELIYTFNERHDDEANGRAMVDAIEMKVTSADEIDAALGVLPEMIGGAFEIPQDVVMNGDPRGLIAALSGSGTLAKIRCGGVEASMIPTSEQIARFMLACKAAGVAFKCTAGLHHPVRAEHALTYEDDAPRGVMHGFLNVFVASMVTQQTKGITENQIVEILEDTSPKSFEVTGKGVRWRDREISELGVAKARESFATSFGSCSFTEPVDDLKLLGML